MPSASKEKGKRWERDCAGILSNAFSDSFIRVPNSGSFTGGKNVVRMQGMSQNQIAASRGDIIPPDEWTGFIAECKHVKPGTVSDLMQGPSAIIDKWWAQANADAREGDFVVMLVKEDRKNPRAVFRAGYGLQRELGGSWMLYRGGEGVPPLVVADMADWLERCRDDVRSLATSGMTVAGMGRDSMTGD